MDRVLGLCFEEKEPWAQQRTLGLGLQRAPLRVSALQCPQLSSRASLFLSLPRAPWE